MSAILVAFLVVFSMIPLFYLLILSAVLLARLCLEAERDFWMKKGKLLFKPVHNFMAENNKSKIVTTTVYKQAGSKLNFNKAKNNQAISSQKISYPKTV